MCSTVIGSATKKIKSQSSPYVNTRPRARDSGCMQWVCVFLPEIENLPVCKGRARLERCTIGA